MPVELALPGQRISAPKPPSRIALDMAFGVGNAAILGDKSRYRSHGAITGAVPAAGAHGYCLDFDPTIPSYVLIPAAHTQLNFTTEDFSAVVRVYLDTVIPTQIIFMRGSFHNSGYRLYVEGGGSLRMQTAQALVWQTSNSAGGAVAAGAWQTLGFSRAGAVILVYVNGIDVTAGWGVHIDPLTNIRPAEIGISDDIVSFPSDGRIEFLRIFRGIALQPSEHLAWHRALA